MVSLLVEEPLLHTPEASYVHWLWTLRREIPNFVIEHQLVESYIVCLYGLETAKPEERALVRRLPLLCLKQEIFQAGEKIEGQLSPKQAEKKAKQIWRKDQYHEQKKNPFHKETRSQLLLKSQVHKLY